MASRATSRLGGRLGSGRFDRDANAYEDYLPEESVQDGDPVDRILTSLDRLGDRIRTLSPADRARPQRLRPAEPDDLQRAIEQISRKRDARDGVRRERAEEPGIAELGARVRALSQEMSGERRRPPVRPAADGLANEVAELRAEVERLVTASSGRSLETAFDTLVARLDDLRVSVDNPRMVGDLVQRLTEIRRLIGSLPSGDQIGVITERLDRLAGRLDDGLGDQRVLTDFGRSLSDLAAAVAQLDKREVIAAIERRLDDVATSIRAIERDVGSFQNWQDSLERQTTTLAQVAQRSEQLPRFAHELERQSVSIERIARAAEGLPRLAEEIDGLRVSLDRPGASLDSAAIRALDDRFAELGRMLEMQLRPAAAGLPADLSEALSRIEEKLSEPLPVGRIAEIEDRIAVLTRSVADIDFATVKDVAALEAAIGRLREDVLAAAGRPDAAFAADIRALVDRLDRLDAPAIDGAAFERLESRMGEIVARLETRPNEIAALADALERLDATMAGSLSVDAIADRVAAAAGRQGGDAGRLAAVETSLARLSDDLRAAAERDRGLLLAIGETVERLALREVGAEAGVEPRPAEAPGLSAEPRDKWDEIERALSPKGGRKAPPPEESDGEDLPRIFGRKAAKAPRIEPEVEALPPGFDVNKPLEPGSGKPRVPAAAKAAPAVERPATAMAEPPRTPSKADFIAAARRAAQAAGTTNPGEERKPVAADKPRGRITFNLRKAAMAGAAILIVLGLAKIGTDLYGRFGASPAPTTEVGATDDSGTPPASVVATPAEPSAAPAEGASPAAAEPPKSETLPPPVSGSAEDAPLAPPSMTPAPGFSASPTTLPADSFAPLPVVPSATAAAPSAAAPSLTPAAPIVATGPETAAVPATMVPAPALPEAIGPKALRDAAGGGNPFAAYEIAARYVDGHGVPQDLAAAVDWYRRAAEADLAPAQYRLGSLYEKGSGTARDPKTAAAWYAKAADAGNSKAMHNLAVINAEGGLGTPDYARAAKWFQQAAERGIRDSQYNLGILYARGLGVPRDLATSYKWFALAATAGDTDSAKKRDDIAQALSKDDLARARLAVETWVVKPLDPKAEDVPPADPAWASAPEHTASVDETRLIARTQAILTSLGFDAGPADGKMGKKTRDAIAAFQASKDLPETGAIDKALIEALGMRSI